MSCPVVAATGSERSNTQPNTRVHSKRQVAFERPANSDVAMCLFDQELARTCQEPNCTIKGTRSPFLSFVSDFSSHSFASQRCSTLQARAVRLCSGKSWPMTLCSINWSCPSDSSLGILGLQSRKALYVAWSSGFARCWLIQLAEMRQRTP